MIKDKSRRKLSLYEYFEALQYEYLIAELRYKIYTRTKDKNYWLRVMEGKKVRIKDISDRNHLPTIFSDEEMKRDFEFVIYKKNIPNFFYKNDEQRLQQEFSDLLHFFKKGIDVKCNVYGEIKVGKIHTYNPFNKIISVILNGTEDKIQLPIADVQRIM